MYAGEKGAEEVKHKELSNSKMCRSSASKILIFQLREYIRVRSGQRNHCKYFRIKIYFRSKTLSSGEKLRRV